MGKKSFWANLQEIDSLLAGKDWMMASMYTVVDPYGLVFYGWGARSELPMQELAAYTAWKDRMLKRRGDEDPAERAKRSGQSG